MSSIIESYNYDIFISYRQKDNLPTPGSGRQGKGERWVSEFVEALKTELESTFKEEISVYFDINPHDGLLETHDVDESLKEKLKCLVFIPIISRTYCDPKAFAWEHEFKAFVNQASQDRFGLKIKLPNGNVANRILPVRIHDLDTEDIKLCESVLGGVLRGIEFIYKEPGVNRSLTPKDHEEKNLNNTNYRNQINKVALAIKEIIQGMKAEPAKQAQGKIEQQKPLEEVRKEDKTEVQERTAKTFKRKLLIGSIFIAVILVFVAILVYPKIFKRDTLEKLRSSGERISIAVMPFQNMTNDSTKNYCEKGIQTLITNNLSDNNEILVRQTDVINSLLQGKGITNYASLTPSYASLISRKLNVDIVLTGNIIPAGQNVRLTAQVIDSRTKEIRKSFQIEGPNKEEEILRIVDSLSFKIKEYLIISILKKEVPSYFKQLIESTKSPDALRNFMEGQNAFMRNDMPEASEWMLAAIKVDSNYTIAKIFLAMAYYNQSMYDQAKKWSLSSYKKRDNLTRMDKISSEWCYAFNFSTPTEQLKYSRNAIELDDQQPAIYYNIGLIYNSINQYDKAISEFEKSLEIFKKWDIKPMWANSYTALGRAYHNTGQYRKEKKLYEKAEKDYPDNYRIIERQAILALTIGKMNAANEYIKKYISLRKERSVSEASIPSSLASIYSEAGILDKAEEYYRRALLLEPVNPGRMNTLAYFLIDKDRNINKGMELIDSALIKSPDNYNYLHTKGWGFYKQGQYREALQILQKSWDLRKEKAIYNHEAFLHLQAAKKAVASQKNK